MQKARITLIATTFVFSASIASALSYSYPAYAVPPSGLVPTTGSCTNVISNLTVGSRGTDVSTLQSFLVSQNYPGGGSWMITGYFGKATEAAVRAYQSLHALPITGIADVATRASIMQVSCQSAQTGGYGFYNYPSTQSTYPYTPTYPNTNPFPFYSNPNSTVCNSLNCPAPTIQFLSPSSGAIGTAVTVYGSGFSRTGNSVRFGNGLITNLISVDGNSVSFTVPILLSGYGSQQVMLGTYPVSVTNANGAVSNYLSFTVNSLGGASAPNISSVNGPTTLAVGTQGTWTLNISSQAGVPVNVSVNWGDPSVYTANTPQSLLPSVSQVLTFTHVYSAAGTYTITFTVSGPGGSKTVTATVSVTGSTTGGQLSLQYLSPSSGSVGSTVTLQGNGFSATGNTVHFGVGGKRDLSSNGTSITFTIPSYVSPCDVIQTFAVCGAPVTTVTPGTYPVYVTNGTGATNVLYFFVQ